MRKRLQRVLMPRRIVMPEGDEDVTDAHGEDLG